jgi:BirA family biotin operon repressor/biotin-[acetyl-CoA-carboxylase] ligase
MVAEMRNKILSVLEQNSGAFVSGAYLSNQLGCSRTAIWKHIEQLKLQGYEIEAVKKNGYRMVRRPEFLDASLLAEGMQTENIGRMVDVHSEAESTQIIAHSLAREGAMEGTLVLAERQNAGRGRLGRSWHSPAGKGVWMSLILRPNIPIQNAPQLTLLSAVVLSRCLQEWGIAADIKWPNDIYVKGKKVAGILTELNADPDRIHYAIVGIGMNVNLAQNDIPDDLKNKATSLRIETGVVVDRVKVIQRFCCHFEQWYRLYLKEGFLPIKSVWEARSISLGEPLLARTLQGDIRGTAMEIDEIGALVIRTDGGEIKKIYSADLEMGVK